MTDSVTKMFAGIETVVEGELLANQDDMEALAAIGAALKSKYDSMNDRTAALEESLIAMVKDYKDLQPYFAQIDSLEISLSKLETMVQRLDTFSIDLERRVAGMVAKGDTG